MNAERERKIGVVSARQLALQPPDRGISSLSRSLFFFFFLYFVRRERVNACAHMTDGRTDGRSLYTGKSFFTHGMNSQEKLTANIYPLSFGKKTLCIFLPIFSLFSLFFSSWARWSFRSSQLPLLGILRKRSAGKQKKIFKGLSVAFKAQFKTPKSH